MFASSIGAINKNSFFSCKGAIAIAVANPTDLVKIRLQAEGKLPVGVLGRYSGAIDAYRSIVKQVSFVKLISGCATNCFPTNVSARSQQEGVAALWTGLGPNIARNAIINAAELASYDQLKEVIPFRVLFLGTSCLFVILSNKF